MAIGRQEDAIADALNPSAIDGYMVIGVANNYLDSAGPIT